MPFLLVRLLARLASIRGWATPIGVFVFVFVTSWPLMALAEPAGSALVRPGNYWWYFVVTTATVGYGDYTPTTAAGHVVGGYIVVGGVAALATVFTKLTTVFEQAKGRRMQGQIAVDARDHLVILGYTPGRTERIATELLADHEGPLVLCAWDEVTTNPMVGQAVEFVRGELTNESVLKRAGVHRARAVLVDARNDNEALAVAVTVKHLGGDPYVVVAVRATRHATLIGHVDPRIRCVQWHLTDMIAEELVSPGIAEVYQTLMSHNNANTYSTRLPHSLGPVAVDRCRTALGRTHDVTVLAARSDDELIVNPGWQTELAAGALLYYIGPRWLSPQQIAQALGD